MNFWKGYKTYICVGLGLITVLLHVLNLLNTSEEYMLLSFFGFGSIAALRLGVKDSVETITAKVVASLETKFPSAAKDVAVAGQVAAAVESELNQPQP